MRIAMIEQHSQYERMRFWNLISQALPVGSFQFSQGLETAVNEGVITNRANTEDWLHGLVEFGLKRLDLPIVARAHTAWCQGDQNLLTHLDQWTIACRETAELRSEERQLSAALRTWADAVGEELPPFELNSFCCLFAGLAANAGATREDALYGYLWMWLENMTLIATKLVPLGHLDAQEMLRRLSDSTCLDIASLEGMGFDELGGVTSGQLMMSARHETQLSRLFRS